MRASRNSNETRRKPGETRGNLRRPGTPQDDPRSRETEEQSTKGLPICRSAPPGGRGGAARGPRRSRWRRSWAPRSPAAAPLRTPARLPRPSPRRSGTPAGGTPRRRCTRPYGGWWPGAGHRGPPCSPWTATGRASPRPGWPMCAPVGEFTKATASARAASPRPLSRRSSSSWPNGDGSTWTTRSMSTFRGWCAARATTAGKSPSGSFSPTPAVCSTSRAIGAWSVGWPARRAPPP